MGDKWDGSMGKMEKAYFFSLSWIALLSAS
jgi:hypothetical protein